MHGDPYVFCHICYRFRDALFDPPRSIRTEFEFFIRIEFFYRLDQSDIPFLDKVGETQSRSEKSFGNTDD